LILECGIWNQRFPIVFLDPAGAVAVAFVTAVEDAAMEAAVTVDLAHQPLDLDHVLPVVLDEEPQALLVNSCIPRVTSHNVSGRAFCARFDVMRIRLEKKW